MHPPTARLSHQTETHTLHQDILRRLEAVLDQPNETVLSAFLSRVEVRGDAGAGLGLADQSQERIREVLEWLLEALQPHAAPPRARASAGRASAGRSSAGLPDPAPVTLHYLDAANFRLHDRPLWHATFRHRPSGALSFYVSSMDPKLCVEGMLHCVFKARGFSHEQCVLLEALGATDPPLGDTSPFETLLPDRLRSEVDGCSVSELLSLRLRAGAWLALLKNKDAEQLPPSATALPPPQCAVLQLIFQSLSRAVEAKLLDDVTLRQERMSAAVKHLEEPPPAAGAAAALIGPLAKLVRLPSLDSFRKLPARPILVAPRPRSSY